MISFMLFKISFLILNTIAPSSGYFITSKKENCTKYIFFFLVALLLIFFLPLIPINWAFFAAILFWPVIFLINCILCFFVEKKQEVQLKKMVLMSLIIMIFSWGLYFLCFQKGRVRLIRTISHSMSPSFHHGEILLIEHYIFGPPPLQRGDIVIYKHPQQDNLQLIKRVVGLGRDKVQSSELLIRSNRYKESLVKPIGNHILLVSNGTKPYQLNFEREVHPKEEIRETLIPENHFFAIGDNRLRSVDSRSYGSVPMDKIVGIGRFLIFSQRKNIYFGMPLKN